MNEIIRRLARTAWTCFFCGTANSGSKCSGCGV